MIIVGFAGLLGVAASAGHVLRSKAVLGGLHHEYWLEKVAA